jgi:hypothetical protein
MEAAVALSAIGRSRRGEPSDTSCHARGESSRSRAAHHPRARFNQGTSMRPIFPSSKVPSAGEDLCPRTLSSASFTGALPTVGRRGQPPHVLIDVRKLRLDLSARRCRGRLVGRMRFYDFCKCMFPRARRRTARTSQTTESVVGTPAVRLKVALQSTATAGGTQGQGSRKDRISTFPTVIAHDGDFAPTPSAPGTSCREDRSSPCPERLGGENGIAAVAPACTARVTRGSCDARLPRRSPTLTNPRCLPSQGRPGGRRRRLARCKPL